MPQQLPFAPSVPSYRVSTNLDGVQYILDVRWNGRDEAWYFDLLDEDEVPIKSGIKIVLGVLLGWRSTNPEFPTGQLIASDLTNEGRDAGFDDIGDRVQVFYFADGEL